jgi:hypothetical protein
VPVLVGGATLEGEREEGVAFVLDLTESANGRKTWLNRCSRAHPTAYPSSDAITGISG